MQYSQNPPFCGCFYPKILVMSSPDCRCPYTVPTKAILNLPVRYIIIYTYNKRYNLHSTYVTFKDGRLSRYKDKVVFMNNTEQILLEHAKAYSELQLQDVFKLIHQSTFGCEHLVSTVQKAIEFIKEEFSTCSFPSDEQITALDGNFSRVSLGYISQGISPETLGKLFYLSAQKEKASRDELIKKCNTARRLCSEGKLPFNTDDFNAAFGKWQNEDFPSLHHSDIFRELYKPSYRVISNDFIPFLPLLIETEKRLRADKRIIMAIEGGSASGKTTLSGLLACLYDCTVFHTDDFFLRTEQRTKERFREIGGNMDRERLRDEILIPLSHGQNVTYQKFNCSSMSLDEPVSVTPGSFTVIEGTYSLHPELADFYSFSVLLSISPEKQRARILKRNSPELAQRFFNEWIPLETPHLELVRKKGLADMII